jgi:hypothetical protein
MRSALHVPCAATVPVRNRRRGLMVRKVFAGRVEFHDGDGQIAPGGHSKGLQCVWVRTKRGEVAIASDATHLYAHIETGRVFPVTYNVGDELEGYATIKKLAPTMHHIVPGHDRLVLPRYPAARPGLEGWVVQLDAEPKIGKSGYLRENRPRPRGCGAPAHEWHRAHESICWRWNKRHRRLSAGVVANEDTVTKPLHVERTAQAGVLAARSGCCGCAHGSRRWHRRDRALWAGMTGPV